MHPIFLDEQKFWSYVRFGRGDVFPWAIVAWVGFLNSIWLHEYLNLFFCWSILAEYNILGEHNAKSENSSSDSMEDITVPIVTNELEPSLWTKVFRLIRNIILFPTKITVILGIASFIWLLCCASWIGYGLTNDHYCPADPRIPQIIAWHGILWVGFSAYIIVRLIWVEINASRSPTCSCLVGNPDVSLTWPKELTYALDTVLFSIIVTCYVVQFILIVGLTRSGAIFYTATTKDWVTIIKRYKTISRPPNPNMDFKCLTNELS